MAAIAIGILWLCIGIIILGGVLWILVMALKKFAPGLMADGKIEWGIWAIFGILILIYLIEALVGGGGLPHPQLFR